MQNHLNEYVQQTSQIEQEFTTYAAERCSASPEIFMVLLMALYQQPPLINFGKLFNKADNDWQQELLTTFYLQPQIKKDFAATLSTINLISDGVSLQVQAMYEENPYPRWATYNCAKPVLFSDFMASTFHVSVGKTLKQSSLPLLVAGCGTGKYLLRSYLCECGYHCSRYQRIVTGLCHA
jgi:hypothetical protein